MASLGSVFVDVLADTSGFEDSLSKGLTSAIKNTAIGGVLGSTVALGVGKAIRAFLPLEQKINEIFQVEGVKASDAMFNALADQIYQVAGEISKPAEEVGASIALGIGRGFDQAASVELTQISGKLSIALGEDLNNSTKAVTASLNGFGLGIEEADRVAGVLYQTLAKSGVPASQLAQQIGNIAPAASTAGISLEDVSAAIATMTQQGISAAESTTQIRTAITELSREGSTGGKVFESISGKTFPQFIKEGHTLQEGLGLIAAASKKSGYSVQELAGNYNTANAVVALTGANTERYTQNLADNKKGVTALADAVDTAQSGALFQFNSALNKVNTGVQQVGGAFKPLTDILLSKLTPAADWVAGALAKMASVVSEIDFTALGAAIDSAVNRLQPFGQLIMSIYNVLSALNWNQIFGALIAAAYPVAAAIGVAATAAKVLAEVIEFLTPVLRGLVDVLSYVIIPLIAFHSIFKIVGAVMLAGKVALLAFRAATLLLGPALRAATIGIQLMNKALMLVGVSNPYIRAVVIAVTALTAAFIYAWRNSQKFREIVVKSVNAVKNAALTAIQFIVHTLASFWKFILSGYKRVIDGLNKFVPDWLGGDKLTDASAGVQNIINGIDSIEGALDGLIVKAKEANWELNYFGNMSKGFVDPKSNGGTFADIYANMNKGGSKKPKGPDIQNPFTGNLDDLLGDKTKDKAADAAKRLMETISDLWSDIAKFAKKVGEKSLDEISNGLGSIVDKFNDLIKQATEDGNKTVAARLKKSLAAFKDYGKTLTALAKKRDSISLKLKDAQDALKEIQDYNKGVKQVFVNLGSVAEASAGIGVTFLGIRNNLRDAIRTTEKFNTAFKQLQALNLNETSLKQLADAGPAALDQALALVRSGANGVAEINKLQKQLGKDAGTVADTLTKQFFDMGVATADGIVKGLQSQESKLIAEMNKLGGAMADAMKKKLQVHSPSKLFEDIGSQVPAGMAQGVRRGTPDVVAAIQAMAKTQSAPSGINVGGVTVHGVSDPAAARRAGLLAGDAIAATLAKRKTAQMLQGVG